MAWLDNLKIVEPASRCGHSSSSRDPRGEPFAFVPCSTGNMADLNAGHSMTATPTRTCGTEELCMHVLSFLWR